MPTAKKLPSGNYRCQVFSHYEFSYLPDGSEKKKRIYESFTAPTKKEAERLATAWAADRITKRADNITVSQAIQEYITVKEAVLSPSTINGYRRYQRNYFSEICSLTIRQLNNVTVQSWISSLSVSLSPKSVHNIYGLLSSTLAMFFPDLHLHVTLPAAKKPDLYTPNDEDVKNLLHHIKGTELEIAVLLAAFGPMRRGEICALESTDISGNTVSVSKSMVQASDKTWHIKQPKNYSSYREIVYPDFVIDRLSGIEGRIIKATPEQISNRFRRAIRFSGLPHFRFHDLRHYAASIMHAIGIPDQYIMARGGWKTDNVMKSVYRNTIDLETEKQTRKISNYFSSIVTAEEP